MPFADYTTAKDAEASGHLPLPSRGLPDIDLSTQGGRGFCHAASPVALDPEIGQGYVYFVSQSFLPPRTKGAGRAEVPLSGRPGSGPAPRLRGLPPQLG